MKKGSAKYQEPIKREGNYYFVTDDKEGLSESFFHASFTAYGFSKVQKLVDKQLRTYLRAKDGRLIEITEAHPNDFAKCWACKDSMGREFCIDCIGRIEPYPPAGSRELWEYLEGDRELRDLPYEFFADVRFANAVIDAVNEEFSERCHEISDPSLGSTARHQKFMYYHGYYLGSLDECQDKIQKAHSETENE